MAKPQIETIKTITIIILISVILSVPLFIISKSIHEIGHIKQAEKQNITLSYPSENMWSLEHGKTIISKTDCEKFNSLNLDDRKKILHAGVKLQMLIFVPLFLILSIILTFYGKRLFDKNKLVFYFIGALTLILFSIILVSLYGNVLSSNPLNDWHLLVLNCSSYS